MLRNRKYILLLSLFAASIPVGLLTFAILTSKPMKTPSQMDCPAQAYNATLVRIVDGDTYVMDVDLGWGIVQKDVYIRAKGLKAAEMSSEMGESDKEKATRLLFPGYIQVQPSYTRAGKLKRSFHRIEATVFVGGENIVDVW